jgi:ABC-type nitrate/sulfonate/bicarbonate transport system substrate-binding protein
MKNKNKLSLVGVERGVSVKMAMRIKTRRDFMKSSTVALVVFLALGISKGASKADNLKIGYGAFSLGYALIWITKEGRLFDKNGLDVDVLYLESNLVRTALIAGDVPIGAMSGAAMATPRLQGVDWVTVLGFQNFLPFRFVVRPEIKSVADLKGRRVGVAGFGLLAERAARLVLAKLGLNPEKDVTLLQTGGEATRLAALINGSIDATVLNPPVHKRAVEAGMRVMANMAEMGIPFQNSALVTTQRYIVKNPDVMRRLVKSFVEGIHLIRTNPEVTKRAIAKYMRMTDQKELDEAYEILDSLTQRKPYPTLEGFKNIIADLSPKIPAARTADPKDFVDVRFLEELDRSGFIDGLYR